MNIVNETGLISGWTLGFRKDGREIIVVVVKATYDIPENPADVPCLSKAQIPLVKADICADEPGTSGTLIESDYAHFKPKCDVVLNGCACAPEGQKATEMNVGMAVGTMAKAFTVYGDRWWEKGRMGVKPTQPEPFEQLFLSYDRAYGGVDIHPDKPDKKLTYLQNPVGIGYYPYKSGEKLVGMPIANTAELGKNPLDTKGKFKPMSFSPICRNFEERIKYTGTYDQEWLDNKAPYWPDDFNYAYFQCAPNDQQIDYPNGGEQVRLVNLAPKSDISFSLPSLKIPVIFTGFNGDLKENYPVVDTIVFEPDKNIFTYTARTIYEVKKDVFEVKEIIFGMNLNKYRTFISTGKKQFENLHEVFLWRKKLREKK
jgi:hypothetical protein